MFDVKDIDLFDLEEEAFDTVMEDDIVFSGSIRFTKPFMIRGKVRGQIEATSDLVIDKCATVEANIKADRVLVRGKTKGNIIAKKLVFVAESGSVDGDITAEQVVLEPGSTFTGNCTMVK